MVKSIKKLVVFIIVLPHMCSYPYYDKNVVPEVSFYENSITQNLIVVIKQNSAFLHDYNEFSALIASAPEYNPNKRYVKIHFLVSVSDSAVFLEFAQQRQDTHLFKEKTKPYSLLSKLSRNGTQWQQLKEQADKAFGANQPFVCICYAQNEKKHASCFDYLLRLAGLK